jgi:advillin
MAQIDPIFKDKSVGAKAGLTKWRIENKLVVASTPDGNFHVGDAYIVLSSSLNSQGKLKHNIHFWIGEECSQDESGIAAYKSVELDAALGGSATHYRECQGNESSAMQSAFREVGGLMYLPGGVESGFVKVERDSWPTRLLHVKGKRNVRVTEEAVSSASLTQDDVYILDMGLKLFIWNGVNCNKYEKTKGLEVVTQINNDQRGARASIVRLDEDPTNSEFWTALGGYVDPSSIPLGDDDDAVPEYPPNRLVQIEDETGETVVTEIALENGKLFKSMLNSNSVYIVVAQGTVYIWVGRGCSLEEKKQATTRASEFVASNGMNKNTPIMRVSDGTESGAFKALFAQWNPPMSFKQLATFTQGPDADIDVAALLASKATQEKPVDDGSGIVEVFIVKNYKLEACDPSTYNDFYGGDSYVVSYTYKVNGRDQGIVYFWLGDDSSIDERGAAALLAVELDDRKFQGAAAQVRVTQGKEPPHFCSIFKGAMVVHRGGFASGATNSTEEDTRDLSGTALFRVKGTTPTNTSAAQVDLSAASLNGEDCFVLITPGNAFVWNGSASTESERASALSIGQRLGSVYLASLGQGGRAVSTFEEGEEDAAFWDSLGGKADYPKFAPGAGQPREARLFEATTSKGSFSVEEITGFVQADLCDEDVYLLDTHSQLFLWVGTLSTEDEKRQGAATAAKFIAAASDGRDADMPVITVKPGSEPSMFTQHFKVWDPTYTEKHSFKDPYRAKVAAMEAEAAKKASAASEAMPVRNIGDPLAVRRASLAAEADRRRAELLADAELAEKGKRNIGDPLAERRAALEAEAERKRKEIYEADRTAAAAAAAAETVFNATGTFSAEELRGRVPGVDPTKKETYLDDAEFAALFEMSRADFAKLPAWKSKAMKQKVGLF